MCRVIKKRSQKTGNIKHKQTKTIKLLELKLNDYDAWIEYCLSKSRKELERKQRKQRKEQEKLDQMKHTIENIERTFTNAELDLSAIRSEHNNDK